MPRGIIKSALFGITLQEYFLTAVLERSVVDGRNIILGGHCEHWNSKVIVVVQAE